MISRHATGFLRAAACIATIALVAGCSFSASTSHLGDLKTATTKDMASPTTTFGKTDAVYAQVPAANLSGAATVQFHLIAEKVAGAQPNTPIPAADASVDLASDGNADYHVTPGASGWTPGTYKIEADLMLDGKQQDQKTVEVTIGS